METDVEDRLDFALYLIEELAGNTDNEFAWWVSTYKLTASEARIMAALNARAPHTVSKTSLLACLNTDAEIKIIDVFVCRIRKKTGLTINTVWGQGYALSERIAISEELTMKSFARAQRGHAWTEEEDGDLKLMFESGSDISVMGEEFQRTERAILERIRALGLRK